MFRKNYFVPVLFIALFMLGAISISAQATVSGKVEMTKADGEKVPVAGAKVECYRLDISATCRSTETNKKGEFLFLGIPITSQVVLAVSGEGISPRISPNLKPGSEGVVIEVFEGDGKVLTEQEVREVIASVPTSGTGELTKEQKEEQAKLEKERAEIEAKNEKARNRNSLWDKYTKEGTEANKNKQYDVAAKAFEEGYQVDPEYLGAAPVFLNLKGDALLNHGITKYNVAVKAGDKAGLNTAKAEVVKLFAEALIGVNKAYQMTKNAKPADIVSPENNKKNNKISIDVAKSIVSKMILMKLAFSSYIADEKEAETAVKLYKDTLVMIPNDPDILAGLGLSLYMAAEFLGDKSLRQESLNYYTEYMKVAPKDHSEQAAAAEFIELFTNEKLKPQKVQ